MYVVARVVGSLASAMPCCARRDFQFLKFLPDINECAENLDDCGQLCDNTQGGFTCDCMQGFQLLDDNKNCTAASKLTDY